MRLGHLIEYLNPLPRRRSVDYGQFDAAHGVLKVDEGAGLPAAAMHGERMVDGRLHQEAIEHGAVVAVVVKPIDEPFVQAGLPGLGAPDDALVQVRDAHAVVLVVEGEEQLVLGLGEVVDAARIGGVENFLLHLGAVRGGHLHPQVALRQLHADRGVAVNAHGAKMHQMNVQAALDDGGQDVVGGVQVVVDRVALVARRLHGVGRGALLCEVDDAVWAEVPKHVQQAVILQGHVKALEGDRPAGERLPGPQADGRRLNGGEALHLQLVVDVAPGEVVHNGHLMSPHGQMQGARPAAKAVPAQNEHLHAAAAFRVG